MNKLGGRKFTAFLVCIFFAFVIFITMLAKGWLTPKYCMGFLKTIAIFSGIFCGTNVASKLIVKKIGGSNGQ